MATLANEPGFAATVAETLEAFSSAFGVLEFPAILEDKFEADTRKSRSQRMWLEGLIAILGLNACLVLDYLIARDPMWLTIVGQTLIITPLALATNYLVKRNPPRWLREGSVAAAMIAICAVNVVVQGNATTITTLFGSICVLITALFVGVVMRLRFPFVVTSVLAMLLAGIISLGHAQTMTLSAIVVGASLLVIGLGIILVASYSLEREERRSYLLCLKTVLQARELATTNEALQQLSSVDKLTGLPNRRTLEEKIEQMREECLRAGDSLSVVVIDVDHFKMVNDVYGHLYGDDVLRRIGGLLPQALRSPDDMAARYGGEEFVLLLPHADATAAMTVAERARSLVEAAGTPLNTNAPQPTMWVTVSCGVSTCTPGTHIIWTELVAAADGALYAAKRAGRNRVEFRSCVLEDSSDELAGKIFFDTVPKRMCV